MWVGTLSSISLSLSLSLPTWVLVYKCAVRRGVVSVIPDCTSNGGKIQAQAQAHTGIGYKVGPRLRELAPLRGQREPGGGIHAPWGPPFSRSTFSWSGEG